MIMLASLGNSYTSPSPPPRKKNTHKKNPTNKQNKTKQTNNKPPTKVILI